MEQRGFSVMIPSITPKLSARMLLESMVHEALMALEQEDEVTVCCKVIPRKYEPPQR